MNNREWLNSLSDEALVDLLEAPGGICCFVCDDEEDEVKNREWLNSLSDEDFADLVKEPGCTCCGYYGKRWEKSCRDGFLAWLKKEHKEDGETNKEVD